MYHLASLSSIGSTVTSASPQKACLLPFTTHVQSLRSLLSRPSHIPLIGGTKSSVETLKGWSIFLISSLCCPRSRLRRIDHPSSARARHTISPTSTRATWLQRVKGQLKSRRGCYQSRILMSYQLLNIITGRLESDIEWARGSPKGLQSTTRIIYIVLESLSRELRECSLLQVMKLSHYREQ